MKKLLILLIALVMAFAFTSSVVAFAEELPGETPDVTIEDPVEEIPEEPTTESAPILSDEDLDKLAQILLEKAKEYTGLTENDVNALTQKIYDLFGGKISESIIIIIIILLAIGITVAGVFIRKHIKLNASKKELAALKKEYNNLAEFLDSFKGEKVSGEVVEAVKHLVDGIKSADTEYLAKIEGELKTVLEQVKAMARAMLLAWGNKCEGVNDALSKAPEMSVVEATALYIKALEDEIKKAHNADAEAVLVELKKKSGV